MATLSKIKRHKVSAWIRQAADLAAKAPDDELKKKTYRVVNDARKQYGMSRQDKKAEVLACIRLGASTIKDLLTETPFNNIELYDLLRELIRDGAIVDRPMQTNYNGPRISHYFPVNTE